jgi:hypothetical protein
MTMLENRTTLDTRIGRRGANPGAAIWLAALLLLALLVALTFLPPLAQPQLFRGFVDDRTFLGVPNFLNVVSNLPFLLIGACGLVFLARQRDHGGAFAHPREKLPYAVFFLGVALTSAGSTYYHLAPDDARLVWDRLPMAFGFMSLLSALIVERISVSAGLRLVIPLLAIGAGSVAYWRWTMLHASENLLPYAVVQYGSIAAIVAIAILFRSRYTRGSDIYTVVALYAAAKAAEVLDSGIYALGGIVSGHTLKHLLAALAIYWLYRMLRLRRAGSGDIN